MKTKEKKAKRIVTRRSLLNLNGSLAVVLPREYIARLGLKPKDEMVVVADEFILHVVPPMRHLEYKEVSSHD